MPEQQPQHVGPYEIVAPLGSGGMGDVYRARDPRLNRDVAVKVLPAEFSADRSRRQRFEQEARAVAALNHPGIVSVYDVGEGWMVTELVDGKSLRGLELTRRQIIDIGAQIADALATAHEAGITHRDLKPENILLTTDGRTKILDFGLAKFVTGEAHDDGKSPRDVSTITNPGTATGTPGYMAPEQVRGQVTDQRADMFSLGIILYELLAGHPPFQGESAVDVMYAIVHQDAPDLPDDIPIGLRRTIKRCLEKNPAKRFQSGRDLAFALRSLSGSLTTQPELPAVKAETNFFRLIVPALIVVAALGAFAWFAMDSSRTIGTDLSAYQFHPFAFTKAQEHSAVWSPNGQSVAYIESSVEQTSLMLQSVDAPAPARLTDVSPQPGQLAWSADGTRIYFLRGGLQAGIYEISTAGGIATRLLANGSLSVPPTSPLTNGQAKGKTKGPGGRGATFAGGSIAAFDISSDSTGSGQHLALWQSVPVEIDESELDINLTENASSASESSVWISSPPGAVPVKYEPAPFAVPTPFTPVYLRFSPDASQIYLSFYGNDGAETWLLPFPAGSGQPRRIFADVPWNRPVAAAWMPDSRHIVLSGNVVPATAEQLWMADVETGTRTAIMAWPEGGQTTPSISPDGSRLLFSHVARDRDIVEFPLDGSAPRTLLASTLPEFGPSWSPKGDQFAYVTRRNGMPELWVRSADGTFDRPVVTAADFPNLETLISPMFSHDGSRIIYTALLAGGGRRRSLAVSPAAGGTPTVVSDGYAASWYPGAQGGLIAFMWLKPDGTLPIAILALGSGDQPREIMEAGGLGAPEFSPTGEWLAAPRGTNLELNRFIGGGPGRGGPGRGGLPEDRRRTIPDVNAQAIAWSRDAQTIYGLSFTSDPPALLAVDVASGEVTTIAEYPGLDFQPLLENTYTGSIRLSLSPDGSSLATATATNQADIWILDGFAQ